MYQYVKSMWLMHNVVYKVWFFLMSLRKFIVLPVSEKSFDPELVLSAVLKHGLDQMYSIGRKLGLTASQMTAITRPIPTNEERLRALFETKAKSIGRKKAGEQLLEACGTIPYSILRKVMDELIGEGLNTLIK